jgi:hypothetical protein
MGAARRHQLGDWTVKVSALALAAGTVLMGAAFGLKNGVLGRPEAQTHTTLSDAGVTPVDNITQPIEVKEIHPDPPSTAPSKPLSSGTLSAMAINVAPLFSSPAPTPATPEFPTTQALPTVSLATIGTQIATASSAADVSQTVHASDEAQRPAVSVRISAGSAAGSGQPHKLGLPTKLSEKPPGRLLMAKTETGAPEPEPKKAPQAMGAPQAAPEQPPPAPPFSHVVGAARAPPVSTPQPVDQGAQDSSDWALQFAVRKSKTEAKANADQLNTRYASVLRGAKISVNQILVNGQTTYAPRVSGLSKVDVAALCQRLKGRDCSIAK